MVTSFDAVNFSGLGVKGLFGSVPADVEFAANGGADLDCYGFAVLPGEFLKDESATALQALY